MANAYEQDLDRNQANHQPLTPLTYLERAARLQVRAQAFGPLTPVDPKLAKEAHDYLLKRSIVKATFDYWSRQTARLPRTK